MKICDQTCAADAPTIDPGVLERVRTELAFGRRMKRVAISIDVSDVEAMLKALGGEG